MQQPQIAGDLFKSVLSCISNHSILNACLQRNQMHNAKAFVQWTLIQTIP
jgi:hypothetical protein